jgi:hypothetical protein
VIVRVSLFSPARLSRADCFPKEGISIFEAALAARHDKTRKKGGGEKGKGSVSPRVGGCRKMGWLVKKKRRKMFWHLHVFGRVWTEVCFGANVRLPVIFRNNQTRKDSERRYRRPRHPPPVCRVLLTCSTERFLFCLLPSLFPLFFYRKFFFLFAKTLFWRRGGASLVPRATSRRWSC